MTAEKPTKPEGSKTPKEAAGELIVDALKPAAKKLGTELKPAGTELAKAGVTLAKAVNVALAPVAALVWGYERILAYVVPALEKKLNDLSPDRVITPSLTVAGPTLESLRFAGPEPTLREMYVNLLATAMDKESAQKAHPAFAEIIRQLTPDEARILPLLVKEKTIPQIKIAKRDKSQPRKYDYPNTPFSLIDVDVQLDHPQLLASYLGNLRRLEIISISSMSNLPVPADDPRFGRLLEHSIIKQQMRQFEEAGAEYGVFQGTFSLTPFGAQFCAACVENQS